LSAPNKIVYFILYDAYNQQEGELSAPNTIALFAPSTAKTRFSHRDFRIHSPQHRLQVQTLDHAS